MPIERCRSSKNVPPAGLPSGYTSTWLFVSLPALPTKSSEGKCPPRLIETFSRAMSAATAVQAYL